MNINIIIGIQISKQKYSTKLNGFPLAPGVLKEVHCSFLSVTALASSMQHAHLHKCTQTPDACGILFKQIQRRSAPQFCSHMQFSSVYKQVCKEIQHKYICVESANT